MKKILCILFLLTLTLTLFSQNEKIDSLKNELQRIPEKEKVQILNELGKAFWGINPEKTIEYGTQALNLAKKLKDKKGEAQSLNNIGVANYYLGNYEAALDFMKKALEIRNLLKNKRDIVSSYNNIGIIYDDIGNYKTALKYYLKALSVYEELEDENGMAITQHNIGVVYENLSNYDKALEYLLKALRIYKKLNDDYGTASALGNIGVVYKDLSNYDKSLKYQLESLEISKKIGDQTGIANSLHNIGIIYINLKNFDKAIEYYKQSLEIEEEIGDKKGVASTLNNIGIIYDDLKNYHKALEYYHKSEKMYEELNDKNGLANAYNNIGVCYQNLGQYRQALKYDFLANKIFKESGNKKGIAATFDNIGSVYLKLGNYSKAKKYLFRSLKLAQEMNTKDLMTEIYKYLSDLYSAMADYENALKYFKRYATVKDSIFTKEKIEKISGMQTEYQVKLLLEKQDKEIALLKKDNEIFRLEAEKQKLIRWLLLAGLIVLFALSFIVYYRYRIKFKANKMLQRLVDERTRDLSETNKRLQNEINERKQLEAQLRITERLAGIGEIAAGVAHEIRNPIAILKSTAQFCHDNYKDLSESKIKKIMDIFSQTSDRINKTVSELLQFAKSSQEKMKEGDISKVLTKVLSFVEDKLKSQNIEVKVSIPENIPKIKLNYDQLYGALLNIILNSIEAMPEGGKLNLKFYSKNNKVILEISDTGSGISAEERKKIFNPFYTTKKSGTGLGLSLVHQVMNLHNGKIDIQSEKGVGTKVILEFPAI